eukprot:scaffold4734_cov261-Chaetoceros_neogracile.AAC.2
MARSIRFLSAIMATLIAAIFLSSSSSSFTVTAFAPLGITTQFRTQSHSDTINHNNNHSSRSISISSSSSLHMSSVLDKPKANPGTSTGSPAVLDRPTIDKSKAKSPSKERKNTGSQAWEIRIYNDGKNTREFVARCLVQIVGHTEHTAYTVMMQAHQNGIAVVGRYVYEVAEMYYGALKKNGIVCDLVPVEEDK